MVIYLDLLSPVSSSNLPKSVTGHHYMLFYAVLLQMGFTYAPFVAKRAVSSYLTFPSLPSKTWRFISVALSLESPPPDVIWHPTLWSSDFPHIQPFGISMRDHLAYSLSKLLYPYLFCLSNGIFYKCIKFHNCLIFS